MKYITSKLTLIFSLLMLFGLTACSNMPVEDGNTGNTDTKGYVVQLVATSNATKAFNLKNTFVKEGYKNTTVNTITKNGKKIHRVQIGPYGKKADGEHMLTQLKKRYMKNPYVNSAVVKTIYGK